MVRFRGTARGFFHDDGNGQAKFRCEFKVALIVRGDGHDGAGAVLEKDEVADPDGNLLAIEGIHRVLTGEEAIFLGGGQIFRFHGRLLHVGQFCLQGRVIPCPSNQFLDQRMSRGENDGAGAVDRVDARGEDFDFFAEAGNIEENFRAVDLPIQLRCMAMTRSGQLPSSNFKSSSNCSA